MKRTPGQLKVICVVCGKETWRWKSHTQHEHLYCSRECKTEAETGQPNAERIQRKLYAFDAAIQRGVRQFLMNCGGQSVMTVTPCPDCHIGILRAEMQNGALELRCPRCDVVKYRHEL